jgi:beta-N-acetylhexosaminidase
VPALDEKEPVVFSSKGISVLRTVLGFEGLVLSDDLEMKAIADGWGVPEAAVMALLAGNDMALICHTLEFQEKALELIRKEAENNAILSRQLEQSWERIEKLWSKSRV